MDIRPDMLYEEAKKENEKIEAEEEEGERDFGRRVPVSREPRAPMFFPSRGVDVDIVPVAACSFLLDFFCSFDFILFFFRSSTRTWIRFLFMSFPYSVFRA